jgi:chromosome partitioning protein
MSTVISVISTKGGVGKTVTAVHLSAYFQQLGATLLVDGDATRSATLWAGPGKLPFKVVPERSLSMEMSGHKYDFIVIDTEANPTDSDLRELVDGSHLAIIPATPDGLGLQGAVQTAEKIRRVSPRSTFRVLLTIVPPRPNRDGEEAIAYLDEQQLPHFKTTIRRLVAFQRCVLTGITVDSLDRTNLGWQDYVQAGDEVHAMLAMRVSAYPSIQV